MKENENVTQVDSVVRDEAVEQKPLSPSQRKLAEVNDHFARTDMTQLFRLIEEVRAENKSKE